MRRPVLTLALGLLCASLWASPPRQVVTGMVIVSPSCSGPERLGSNCHAPLAGVEVQLLSSDARLLAQTVTDREGQFKLLAPTGQHELRIIIAGKLPACPVTPITVGQSPPLQQRIECDSGRR